jgi:hypothetical protein
MLAEDRDRTRMLGMPDREGMTGSQDRQPGQAGRTGRQNRKAKQAGRTCFHGKRDLHGRKR